MVENVLQGYEAQTYVWYLVKDSYNLRVDE